VVRGGEVMDVKRDGKTVAEIRPKVGVSRAKRWNCYPDPGSLRPIVRNCARQWILSPKSSAMAVAIDTSVLISAEQGDFEKHLPTEETGAALSPRFGGCGVFGGHSSSCSRGFAGTSERTLSPRFQGRVSGFREADAAQLALLISELKSKGQQMEVFDAAIAAVALARNDKLLVLDDDFDRLKDRIELLRPGG
jgi:hypothetical protein